MLYLSALETFRVEALYNHLYLYLLSIVLCLFLSTLGQRCIKYKGSILWNTLPDDLKCISSIGSFIKNLQELFIADYMYNI